MDRRERILRWLLNLVGLACLLLGGYIVLLQWRAPMLDLTLPRYNSNIVYDTVPGGRAEAAGLRAGDVILAVDSVPFNGWHRLQWGSTFSLDVERDGNHFVVDVAPIPMAQLDSWRLISLGVIIPIFWCVSMLLLNRRFQQVQVRLLFLLCQVLALLIVIAIPYPWPIPFWLLLLSNICFHLMLFLFLHFHLLFPVPVGTARARRAVLLTVLALAFVLTILYLFNADLGLRASNVYSVVVVAATVFAAGYAYRWLSSPADRRRLRLIIASTSLCMVPIIFGLAIPNIAGTRPYLTNWQLGPFIAIIPLAYLYATVRHNLFDIDRLLNRALVYALLSVGIFILYLVPLLLIYQFLPSDPWVEIAVVTGLTLLVGLAFDQTRTRVQRVVDRIFYGGWYDYPGVVETISDELARSIERQQLIEVLTVQVPSLMQLHRGQVWIGEAQDAPVPSRSSARLEIPLRFQGEVRAVWTVGHRRDGEDFTPADRRIVKTLTLEAEVALGNVLLVELLRRQLDELRAGRELLVQTQHQLLRSREEERAHLARELHDGPIQDLVGLNLQLGLLLATGQNPTLGEPLQNMRTEVRELLTTLRQVCAELRPPMLDTMGLGAALRVLADDWSRQCAIPVCIDLPADATLRALPGEVAVNLYRLVQEALANVAHHAAAHQAEISLFWNDSRLTLSIRDDGRGFVVPATLRSLAAQGHFGLAGMQERVALIGGSCMIDSAPGRGTIVHIEWQTGRDYPAPTK